MVNNDALPRIEVDPETFAITHRRRARGARRPPRSSRSPSCYSHVLRRDAMLPPPRARRHAAGRRTAAVGGHTQSAGLEPAAARRAASRADVAGVPARTRLRTVVAGRCGDRRRRPAPRPRRLDPRRRRARPGPRVPPARRARRLASTVGRGCAAWPQRLWPDGAPSPRLAPDAHARRGRWSLGAIAAAAGLDGATHSARLVGYDDVQSLSAAALKLLPARPGRRRPVAAARRPRRSSDVVAAVAAPHRAGRHTRAVAPRCSSSGSTPTPHATHRRLFRA